MTTRIKARRVFKLSDSPYQSDVLRHYWESNDERRQVDVYDLKDECGSKILWEFTQ